jgi:SAM-dependent methyltransferase
MSTGLPHKTVEQGKEEVIRLCRYFGDNRDAFRAPGVKEAHIRQSLIDPLFEALGWDVHNAARVAPQYREVIPEDSLEVEGQQKTPDYTFRVGTLPKFYAEAKKCGVNIADDPAPAYQLRRYGWSAKLPLSILTDFEELAVYHCTQRPRPTDKAGHARILLFGFEEYPSRWEELWNIFSREAVWSGAYDRYAASKRAKRGTSEVDAEFLKEIEGWREELARHVALRNERLAPEELNRAVQLIIDRIVFLRMAEDRRLEPFEQLLKLCDEDDIYARFANKLCGEADRKYNSGLFHFHKEAGVVEEPDRITPALAIDDKVLRPILQSLYFAHGSPYEFSVLPVEILGTVYEQFLGKVIHLSEGHRAKVEEKPEVRKAGGVYYTPACIVDYIVRNTVGPKIRGRSPAQLAGRNHGKTFRVLDMACGSGSFLLRAYQCLLDHCLAWYLDHNPEAHAGAVYQNGHTGQWRLTIQEKKRILTTHVFGVDIDAQAVEVTKLSLLLKVLEGENDRTYGQQMLLIPGQSLPNLAANIQCGNSLIGPDYFTGRLIRDVEEMKRVNPLDWSRGFPDAMKDGGFDCVIGNPPYVRIQTMREWAPLEVEVYKELFEAASAGNYDIYVVFVERGLQLLSPCGRLGFILPHKFFNAQYGQPLRGLIARGKHLAHVVHFGDQQVFAGATTYTCLLFLDKAGVKKCRLVKVSDLEAWKAAHANGECGDAGYSGVAQGTIPAGQITAAEWNFHVGDGAALLKRLTRMPVKLRDVATGMFVGQQTSADPVYVFKEFKEGRSKKATKVFSKEQGEWVTIESAILKRVVRSGDIGRFRATPEALVLFPYEVKENAARLYEPKEMEARFPRAWEHLNRHKKLLRNREKGAFRDKQWYRFGRTQNLGVWEQPKLMIPYMVTDLSAYLDKDENLYFVNVTTGGYGITADETHGTYAYLCGLLNSRLLDFCLKRVSTTFHGGYFAANKQFIERLPIRTIDFSDKADKARHDRMVALVESMLALHKQLAAARPESERTVLTRQIDSTDDAINRLVYDLYGLSDEEIAVVEANRAAGNRSG